MKWSCLPIGDFEAIAPAWDALNRDNGARPFFDARAIRATLRWYGAPSLRVLVGEHGGAVRAAGIFAPRARWQWQTWQPSQLPLGAWLMAAGLPLDAALPGLLPALPGLTLSAGLTQLDPALCPRPQPAARLRTLDYVPTARVRIEGDFEAYWAARGKNLRHNIKRQQARLAASGVHAQLECLHTRAAVADAIADYCRLEGASWKASLGTALTEGSTQARYYRDLLETFCATDQTRIYRYRFDDTVVAVDLCLTAGDQMVILKTTFDDQLQGYSPGVLMHRDIFGQLFEQGTIRAVEFYGRVMEWHTRWTDEVRMLYHATQYRSAALPRAAPIVRRLRERWRPPARLPLETA